MEKSSQNQGELERTLGLGPALAIGVGTMVGAGIFVFPGIAGGEAGPAAVLSFLLGGCIALIVALSTTELATAMPQSGGGYYFVSRTYGPLLGSTIGIAQFIGLIFASSFYLVGFGEYFTKMLNEAGIMTGSPVLTIALITAIVLTIINVIGTKGAGKFQNSVVIVLTGVLIMLLVYGVLDILGITGTAKIPESYFPNGYLPIFSTTALIFTSYLGFVQIATVAGEIKNPSKNLPRALIGSVLIVMSLYILTLYVSTCVFSPEKLSSLGETATVAVVESIVGRTGALIVMAAGLLATISSANASILSSSRAVFALSKDKMVPDEVSKVNQKFGTPHIALLLVGISIAALTLLGNIEVLAEVASLLHLIIYGLICTALITLRRRNPIWYLPSFKVSAVPFLPAAGAIACFGLIAFMQPLSIIIGLSVVAASAFWYAVYAKDTTLSPPTLSATETYIGNPRILMPIELPDPKPVPDSLLSVFKDLEFMILGYKQTPEQTSPEQAREELDDEVREEFDQILENIKRKGYTVSDSIVFTPDIAESINRYVEEEKCNAVLTAKPAEKIERLLVPLYSVEQLNKEFAIQIYQLVASSNLPATLINLASFETQSEESGEAEDLEKKAIRLLTVAGLQEDQIHSKSLNVDNVTEAVQQIADEDDLIILSEAGISDRKSYFNTIHNEISEAVNCSVLALVRSEEEHS